MVAITNESVSLESGDILALPENGKYDVDLDSQPFPTNKEMQGQAIQQYISELVKLVNSGKDHMRNINAAISE